MRSTRFAVRGLAVAAALALALAACDEDEVAPPPQITVTVAPQTHSMNVGETVTLHATVSGSTNQSVTWESNNTSVATVNSSGVVTAVSAGTAVIIAKSVADPTAQGTATITVNPPPAIEVTVAPQTATIQVGQTVPLTAIVSNTTNQAVTWSSRTPSVATVDQSGVVTGVSAGTAVIEARAQADPSAPPGLATITVLPEVPVTVVIQDIRMGGMSANRSNLSGQVEVVVEFDAPAGSNVSKVEVLVDDEMVCSQNIGSGEPSLGDEAETQATFVCSILTDEYDPVTGAARFLNGDHDISARISTPAGSIRAEAGETVRFNNADTWVVNVEPQKGPAADDNGAAWYGGNVVVTAVPVLYSGRSISAVQISFFGVNKAGAANDDGSFSATYSATSDIPGENVGEIDVEATVAAATYEGGQSAPTAAREWQVNGETVIDDPADAFELRLDNQAPIGGTFELTVATTAGNPAVDLCCSNDWVGAAYEFAAGKTGEDDTGVGLEDVVFYWGQASQTEAQIKAAGQVVETGADIPETQTNTEVTVIAVITDRLGNETIVRIANNDIGVDHGAPELGDPTGPEDGDINPGAGWNFPSRSDTLSGFDLANMGIVKVIRNFGNDGAACVVGQFVGQTCVPLVTGAAVPLPGGEGYFTMSYAIRDQAGNATAADPITILVDVTDPTISGPPVFPSTLTGGQPATFGIASIADNVDLDAFDLGFEFQNGVLLPMGSWKVLGDGFGGDRDTLFTDLTYEVSHFIRSVEETDGADAPAGVAYAATAIFFRAVDVAGNGGTSTTFAFAGGTVPAGQVAADYAATLQTFVAASDQASVCDIEVDGSCGGVPQSATISAVVTGPTGSFTNPYARVWFYRVDQNTGRTEFIGEATSANQEDDGSVRTFTYRITLNAAGLGVQTNMPIFALAITKDGDALLSQAISINVVQ